MNENKNSETKDAQAPYPANSLEAAYASSAPLDKLIAQEFACADADGLRDDAW